MAEAAPAVPEPAPDAAAEAARLFGDGEAPAPAPAEIPEGVVVKYWQAAKGDKEEYARHLAQGYTELNRRFTQATQGAGDDPVGETPELYWTRPEDTPEALAEKYDRLDFGDIEAIRDISRSAHAAGLGPKRAQAIVDGYLDLRQKAAPEVETDEARRSRVIHEMGPQGAQMASAVATFIGARARSGELSAEQVAALMPVAESAAGMEALFKLSRASLAAPPAMTNGVSLQAERDAAVAQLKKDLADPSKLSDPEFLARYRSMVKEGYTLDGRPVPVEQYR